LVLQYGFRIAGNDIPDRSKGAQSGNFYREMEKQVRGKFYRPAPCCISSKAAGAIDASTSTILAVEMDE
jgi:hypothetical protein